MYPEETINDKPVHSSMRDVDNLIQVMADVMRTVQEKEVLKRRNLILSGLNKTDELMDDLEMKDMRPYILDAYVRVRPLFLDPDNEDWIETPDLYIWYGSDVDKVKVKGYKLLIGQAYIKALALKDAHLDKFNGNEEHDRRLKDHDIMNYPDEIAYYTMKIFADVLKDSDYEEDIDRLKEEIDVVGASLGIIPNTERSRNGLGLSGILQNITKAAGNSGVKLGENGPDLAQALGSVDESQVSNMLGQFFGNKEIQTSLGNAFGVMNKKASSDEGPGNISDVFSGVFSAVMPAFQNAMGDMNGHKPDGVQDDGQGPEQMDAMKDSFQKMAEAAENMVKTIPKPKPED